MDFVTLGIVKKMLAAVTAGISDMRIENNILKIILTNGSELSYTFPTPQDGKGIKDIKLNQKKELIVTLTDNSSINAGMVPLLSTYPIKILTQEEYDNLEKYEDDTFYFIREV